MRCFTSSRASLSLSALSTPVFSFVCVRNTPWHDQLIIMIIPFVTIFIILILIVTILIEIILINIILIIKILVIISTFAIIIRYLPHLQADNEVFELRVSKPTKGTSLSVHCHYNLHRS